MKSKNINCYTVLILFLFPILNFGCSNTAESHDIVSRDSILNLQNEAHPKDRLLDNFRRGEVILDVPCLNDSSQSYALYIPKGDSGKAMPVLYLFDPSGRRL